MPHRKNPHFEEVSKLATQSTPLPELITWYNREAKLCTLSFLAPPLNEASLHRCIEETSPPATRLNSCNSFNKPDFLSSFYLQEQKLLFLVLQEFTFTQVYVCLESWPAICSTKHVLILIKPLPFLSLHLLLNILPFVRICLSLHVSGSGRSFSFTAFLW